MIIPSVSITWDECLACFQLCWLNRPARSAWKNGKTTMGLESVILRSVGKPLPTELAGLVLYLNQSTLTSLTSLILYKAFYELKKTNFIKAKEKYRGVFKIQKSGDKTSSGEIGLDIRTHASPKVGQDQVSGGVSVLCWHAATVAYVLWKPCTTR